MKSYSVLAKDSTELKNNIFEVSRKSHYLGLGPSNLKAAHPVNYFPAFLGKNIKNCPPSKLFLPPWSLRPISGADRRKLQPNLTPTPYLPQWCL